RAVRARLDGSGGRRLLRPSDRIQSVGLFAPIDGMVRGGGRRAVGRYRYRDAIARGADGDPGRMGNGAPGKRRRKRTRARSVVRDLRQPRRPGRRGFLLLLAAKIV